METAAKSVSQDRLSLLNKEKSVNNKKWSTIQLLLIVVICVIVSILASNFDRIIQAFEQDNGDSDDINNNVYDVVIVGAGITGLTQSYFLNEYYDYKILTVERFNRVGGRTHSVNLKHNGSKIVFENGAASFPYNSNLYKLLNRMNLCDDMMLFEDEPTNPNYLYRNTWKPIDDVNVTNYWGNIYNFNNIELNWLKSGDNIWAIGYNEILLENNNGNEPVTNLEWNSFWTNWTFKGVPVHQWSTYAFIKHAMNVSTEYFAYLDRNRFDRDRNLAKYLADIFKPDDDVNINNSIPDRRVTLKNGYDQLCRRIYDNVSASANNEFWFEKKVIGINYNDKNDKYRYIVHIQDVYELNNILQVYTNKIILSIPPAHLKELLPYIPPIDTEYTRKLIDSVPIVKCYKVNLIYDSDFWINENISQLSSSRTDNNLGRFLIANVWTNGTLTNFHIYSQGQDSDLFHILQSLNDPYPIKDGIEIDNENEVIIASTFVVNEITKQLQLLTKKNIPLPIAAFASPFGWNTSSNDGFYWKWKYGTIESEILENIFNPIPEEDIYITSSSYSYNKAFHSGGIWAALENLKRNFNINEPLMQSECQRIY